MCDNDSMKNIFPKIFHSFSIFSQNGNRKQTNQMHPKFWQQNKIIMADV